MNFCSSQPWTTLAINIPSFYKSLMILPLLVLLRSCALHRKTSLYDSHSRLNGVEITC